MFIYWMNEIFETFCNLSNHKFHWIISQQVKTTSKSGGKSTVQRVSISVDENFQIQEINRSKKSKAENLAKPESTGSSNADPDKLMQTTFRLGLRISEQEAKNQVMFIFNIC